MSELTRVEIERDGNVAHGVVVARRDEKIFVVVHGNPKADGWYPVHLWNEVS